MFQNYFKIAWRNLQNRKAYVLINTLGLSLGIACGILIFNLVSFHLGFDTFHKDKDRIYRVVTEFHDEGVNYSAGVPSPLGKAFRNDLSYADKVARVIAYPDGLVSFEDKGEKKKFNEEHGIAYVEPEFFSIFNFPLVQGNQADIFREPNEAVITAKMAKKYFGESTDVIGRTIRVSNQTDFKIVGILQDLPKNTDRQNEIYLSYENIADQNKRLSGDSSWGSVYSESDCFVLLKPGVTAAQANQGLDLLRKKYNHGRDVKTQIYRLQPLSDVHFNPDFDGYVDKKYLWALCFIGLFIIVTACVNFINLATAQSLNRSTEVGIRKVLGGVSKQIFWQFIVETALIAVFALILGYLLALYTLPYLNNLVKSEMNMRILGDPASIAFAVLLLAAVIFLSGSYPGLVLSRFQPVLALKSKLSRQQIGGISLRRVLVVSQFAISQMLIIGTIIIAGQLRYAQNLDLGFDKSAVVMLPIPEHDITRMNTLRASLQDLAGVTSTSLCLGAPAWEANSNTNLRFGNRAEDEHWEVNTKRADADYIKTFGLHLVAGRNFFPSDSTREFVINETMARKLGFRDAADVIGKQLKIGGRTGPVVGVVKDFFNNSLHSEIQAIAIYPDPKNYDNCAVKIQPAHIKQTLASLEKVWNGVFPEYVYSSQFLDDSIAKFYELDDILLKLIEGFALIAVLIGCLGLYGLASYMAVRKRREIGIRKVLGAGVPQILWLFGKEFSWMVLLAFCIAAPPAWWAMHQYLQDFKYRIIIGPGIFLLAIAMSVAIVLLTVSYQSLRSALTNPVKSLRMEG